jgi:lipoprotein-anchoring transpeptidase ErfK/SrfK
MRTHAAALAVAVLGSGAAGAVAEADVPASRPLAVLLNDHVVRRAPSFEARRVEVVHARRPLTKVRTALPVIEEARGGTWLRVRLPGRPNGHTGWVRAAATHRAHTPWLVTVRLSTRRVTVFHHGRVVRRFRTVIGRQATPTPRGRFFVEEAVTLGRRDAGGPYALALSARSAVFQEFHGGPGQTALHGTAGLSGALGTAASHGCLRLSTKAITWLARRLGPGAPVHVRL